MARIKIPHSTLNRLRKLREETGVGPMRLLRGRNDVPKGLNSGRVSGWLSGCRKRADEAHLNYILEIWPKTDPMLNITPKMVDVLNEELSRTSVSLTTIAKAIAQHPHRLSANSLSKLRKGQGKIIRKSLWEAILTFLAAHPNANTATTNRRIVKKSTGQDKAELTKRKAFAPSKPPKEIYLSGFADDYITLTDVDREVLIVERTRSGVGAAQLLRKFSADKPDKLSANTISAWINQHSKRASTSRLKWVLAKWRSLPDRPKN